jgi:hypothetical protein
MSPLGVVVGICNSNSLGEAEAPGAMGPGWPELHNDTLSQKQQKILPLGLGL